jgi:hypothetical protein
MKFEETPRGFELVEHETYPPKDAQHDPSPFPDSTRLVQQSSAIGNYPDAMEKPGSSFLWVGQHHHLNRDDVRELAERLQAWLTTGSLKIGTDEAAEPAAKGGATNG